MTRSSTRNLETLWLLWMGMQGRVMDADLEAQVAALREERDELAEKFSVARADRNDWETKALDRLRRAETAEAEVRRLQEMLARVRPDIDPETGYGRFEAI